MRTERWKSWRGVGDDERKSLEFEKGQGSGGGRWNLRKRGEE
jgi:hypothetical protein